MANNKRAKAQFPKLEGQLYTLSYDADEKLCHQAAALYGSPKLRLSAQALFALGMLIILCNMFFALNDLTVLIFGLLFAVSGAVASRNWHNVQAWALMGTNLGESKDDTERQVIICETEVVVRGPKDSELHYPLDELKRVSSNSNGILASFGKARVAYIPSGNLSATRQAEVERFLKDKTVH